MPTINDPITILAVLGAGYIFGDMLQALYRWWLFA